jgi:hypothetical protein
LGSSATLIAAYLIFFLGSDFAAFAAAQIALAAGIALNSGSDTSFHYDSLAALGREVEYGEREAIVARNALLATSLSALLGGAAAVVDLRWAYGLSAIAALAGLGIVAAFTEPDRRESRQAAPFVHQVRDCLAHLKRPALAWLFGFVVLLTILNHVPYEFYQPYLDLLGARLSFGDETALASGMHMAIATVLGAVFARRSMWIAGRLGTGSTLVLAALLQLFIIAAMASVLHGVIVALIVLRGIPGALTRAPLNAAVTPRIPQQQRATYLSIQSLAARLGFSGLLAGLSLYTGGVAAHDWPVLSDLLVVCAVIGALGLGLLALGLRRVDLH